VALHCGYSGKRLIAKTKSISLSSVFCVVSHCDEAVIIQLPLLMMLHLVAYFHRLRHLTIKLRVKSTPHSITKIHYTKISLFVISYAFRQEKISTCVLVLFFVGSCLRLRRRYIYDDYFYGIAHFIFNE